VLFGAFQCEIEAFTQPPLKSKSQRLWVSSTPRGLLFSLSTLLLRSSVRFGSSGYPFWGSGTRGQKVMNIFTITSHLVPPQFRDQCADAVEFVWLL
jgi:hypothetical protein